MKKFYNFFLGLIFFLQGRVSQVTEVYTTVDPRENSGYIVNGGSAKVGDRKEIVSIQFDGEHKCGGVIVGNKWILSAAHCLKYFEPRQYHQFNRNRRRAQKHLEKIKIIIGEFDRRIPADDRSNTKFEVVPKRVILHPDILPSKMSSANQQRFGKHPFYHDLILFEVPDLYDELAKKQKGNKNLCNPHTCFSVLRLTKPTEDLTTSAQKSCSIWGWGTTENKNEFPNKLKKGKVDILTADDCISWNDTNDRKGWKKGDFHQDYEFCAIGKTKKNGTITDTCNGDSGGPLICEVFDGPELLGIISWGKTDCTRGYPSIYAAVNERETHDWILSYTQTGIQNSNIWTQWTQWTECMCHDDQTSGMRTRKKTCTLQPKDQCRFENEPLPKRSHQIQQNCFCANTPSPPLGVPTPEPCGHGYENSWGEWSEWDVCKIIDERRCDGRRLRTRKCCGTCDRGSSRDSGPCKVNDPKVCLCPAAEYKPPVMTEEPLTCARRHGSWSNWGEWGECRVHSSNDCSGQRKRRRIPCGVRQNELNGSTTEYGKCHNKEPNICVPDRRCPGSRRGPHPGGPYPRGPYPGSPYPGGFPRPYFPALRPIPTIAPMPAIPSFGNQQFGQFNHAQNNQWSYGQHNRPNSPRPQPKRSSWDNDNGQSWGNTGHQRPKWGNSGMETGQEWPNQPNDWRRPK